MPLDPTNNIIQKVTLPPTDFSKIKSAAPLMNQQRPEPATRVNNPNQERREDRVKRENLLRYYDAEFNTGKRELETINKILADLENKIRNEEKEVDILENDQTELKLKLIRIEKNLRRFKFELRAHKGDQMEKRVVQRRWQETVKEAEAKLKKIKYGDWRSIRR
jgi:hypothetical protein